MSSSTLWRRVVQVSGAATELLGLSATNGAPGLQALEFQHRKPGTATDTTLLPPSGPPKLQVLFIPGNPGSAQYYTMQLGMLHSSLGGDAEVLAVSHAGHDPQLAAADAGRVSGGGGDRPTQ